MPLKFMHAAISGAFVVSALAGAAQAAPGTQAGSTISNTATVGYAIGGVSQPSVQSSTVSFVVDRKVNLVVAEVGGAATVSAYGQADQVTTFTVTNATNATQDIRLYALNAVLGTTTTLNHTDTIGVQNIRVFADVDGDGRFEPGVDTATFLDEVSPQQTRTVFVVADLPASGPAGGVASVILHAVVAQGGASGALGADLTASLLDDPAAVDTVFADGAGFADLARDGRFSAEDEYDVYGVSVEAMKSAIVVSDPVNGLVAPKAIPGAVVEYCIAVRNIGAQPVTAVALRDQVPANTTYVPGSTFVGGTTLLGACLANGVAAPDAAAFDGSAISAVIPSLGVGEIATTRFRVTLD